MTRVAPLSLTPGRGRWEITGDLAGDLSWSAVEARLGGSPGIREVRFSEATLRVLILFDRELSPEEVEDRLTCALDAETRAPSTPEASGADQGDGAGLVTKGALAGGALLVAVAATAGAGWALATGLAIGAGAYLLSQALDRDDLRADRANVAGLAVRAAPFAARVKRGAGYAGLEVLAGVARVAVFAFGVDLAVGGGVLVVFGCSLGGPLSLALLGLAAAGLTGLQLWARYRSYSILFRAGRDLQHRLRVEVFDHVQRLPMEHFAKRSPGQLAYVVVDDVNQIERTIDAGARILAGGIAASIQLVLLVYVSPPLGLVSLGVIGLLAGLSLWLQPRLRAKFGPARAIGGRMSGEISAVLQGVSTVRAFEAEGSERARVARSSLELREAIQKELPGLIGAPLLQEGVILAGLLAASLVESSSLAASTGGYFGSLLVTSSLFSTLSDLGSSFTELSRGLSAFGRIQELLDAPVERAPENDALALPAPRGEVVYDRVDFAYPGGPRVLRDVSLALSPGKTVAVVGLSGSGKSTLVSLLLGFYDVERGRILLDGVDISRVPRAELRRRIAVVSQDVQLFPFSIRDNIALGEAAASDAEIESAARLAHIDDRIRTLPEGYATVLADRGTTLSGGQRQRVAIARALLKDAPILVLDEATSHLDTTTDDQVQRSIRELSRGRAVLVIAHRLSTIEHADYCYVVERGTIVEHGTHRDLLEAGGSYRRLWAGEQTSAPKPPDSPRA